MKQTISDYPEIFLRKSMFTAALLLLIFTGTDCKKESNTIVPPDNPPDTTSHNFAWTQYTFGGQGGSSYFKDVAIISDSNIWVVGKIRTDSLTYNAAHWDGTSWELRRILFYTICGQPSRTAYPISSILAFGSNDVWIAMDGSQVVRWSANSQTATMCLPVSFSISKLWGTSANSMYAVGSAGTILYYNGTSWAVQQSGTTIDLRDVWGSADGRTVWACGYSLDLSQSCLLRYDLNTWTTIWLKQSNPDPYGDLALTGWSSEKYLYVGADQGVYRSALTGVGSVQQVVALPSVPHGIRGSADNNIAVACDDQSIWHYNGATWLRQTASGVFKPLYSIAVSKNTIIGVGFDATNIDVEARVSVGKRTDANSENSLEQ